jgi:hypothetical protein
LNASSLLIADIPVCCDGETWKPIPLWPRYEASSCGQVRSLNWIDADGRLHLGALLPQFPDRRKGKGYLYVMLQDGKRRRKAPVAAVVLEAHCELRPGPDYEACHGPAGRTENHLRNLRWDTKIANLAEMWEARRAVTGMSKRQNLCHKSQVTGGASAPAALSQLSVTSDRPHGTGSPRPIPIFPSNPIPLKPSIPSLRTSFRSLRSRLAS